MSQARSGQTAPQIVRENPVLRQKVWGKMHLHDDNWMGAVVGPTGSGKSWGAIRIAEAVDPDFTVDQVAFGMREFMELVNDDSLDRGSVIVFEEASVEANAQEWFSKGNKVLRQVLDTWRHQNRGAIFTLPAFGQLDRTARGRMSSLIQMRNKNEDDGFTVAKFKRLQQDSDSGKIYRKYPVLKGKQYKLLKLNKPSKELREAYEAKKEQYTEELNQELLDELLEDMDDADDSEEVLDDPREIVDDIVANDNVDDYIATNPAGKYIDRNAIEFDYDVGGGTSKKVKAGLKREVDHDLM